MADILAPTADGAVIPGHSLTVDRDLPLPSPLTIKRDPESPFLLPLPSFANNPSTLSFALSDVTSQFGADIGTVPADEAGADLSIAADGSFVETSSPHAARELKKRYDQLLGIGMDNKTARSPYIITAVPTQRGQVFRISHRSINQSEPLYSPQNRTNNIVRRARLSVGGFLPPLFKTTANARSGSSVIISKPRRTLRKNHSISDMSSKTGNPISSGLFSPVAVDIFSSVASASSGTIRPTSHLALHNFGHSSQADTVDEHHLFRPTNAGFPFGPGITYTAPAPNPEPPPTHLAPSASTLRLMQSFESGLTARADADNHSPPLSHDPSSQTSNLSPETNSTTPYSPAIFEILQTFHGIPLPSTLSATSGEPTIKLSSTMTAVPRDDPRFVIWGQIHVDLDDISLSHSSHASHTDLSTSSVTSLGRKKSSKGQVVPDAFPPSEAPKKILMAATIERWIAQLTSELNYDELLHFFLTYRTYINAVDLCQLLICRFHWALERPSSSEDATVRRIVCVRTFLAFRYWLLTFFRVDFLHNRLLCVTLTTWLNTLQKDNALSGNTDAASILRKLKKVVRDCKAAHSKHTKGDLPISQVQDNLKHDFEVLRATTRLEPLPLDRRPDSDRDGSDVDLDFDHLQSLMDGAIEDQFVSTRDYQPISCETTTDYHPHNDPAPLGRAEPMTASQVMLQQPLHMTILTHTKSPASTAAIPSVPNQGPLPLQHGAFSRAFVNTIGRLGRWKRVLNSRSSVPDPLHCHDISSFDLELNATGDLLTVRGGVEEYLRMLNLPPMAELELKQTGFVIGSTELATGSPSIPGKLILPKPHDPSRLPAEQQNLTELPTLAETLEPQTSDHSPTDEPEACPPLVIHQSLVSKMQYYQEVTINPISGDTTSYVSRDDLHESSITLVIEPREGVTALPSVSGAATATQPAVDGGKEDGQIAPADMNPIVRSSDTASQAMFSDSCSDAGPLAGISIGPRELQSNDEKPISKQQSPATSPPSKRLENPHAKFGSHQGLSLDIVSLDDYDLSGSGSESNSAAPRTRKPPRRLPLRRDFEFVRHSGSVSSFGMRSPDTYSPVASTSEVSDISASPTGPGPAFGHGGIKTWQIEMIDSDDDEPGDVEAALKRLEGQIDKDRQKAKEVKVDGWLRQVRQRLATGEAREDLYNTSTVMTDNGDERLSDGQHFDTESRLESRVGDVLEAVPSHRTLDDGRRSLDTPLISGNPPTAVSYRQEYPPIDPEIPRSNDKYSEGDDRLALCNSSSMARHRSASSVREPHKASLMHPTNLELPHVITPQTMPTIHRSLVLMHRSQALAEQFGLIDRELFLAVRFEELLVDWKEPLGEVPVYDWAGFQRERSRLKAHVRCGSMAEPSSDLYALWGRYHHMVNFTSSEIVLSPTSERPAVAGKMIRVAWKCYLLNNFSTLVAIIQGLQTPAATIAMRRSWSRVGMWEMRLFDDFRAFTNSEGNFRHIRDAIASLADSRSLHDTGVTSSSGLVQGPMRSKETETRTSRSRGCVPFVGIYLSQLHVHAQLPDYVDPTSPTSLVTFDPVTGHLNPPLLPNVFSNLCPLPPSLTVEPIINVHKQRLIAGVIKSVVAGQHLAMNWGRQITTDRKLYQKCSRLRCFDPATQMNLVTTMGPEN